MIDPWNRSEATMTGIVVVGLAAGFASGLFGVGGGIVIVPALVFIAGFPHKLATGTSLGAIVPVSLAGIIGYADAGQVDWAAAGWASVGALIGAILGTGMLDRVSVPLLQLLFAGAMGITALRMVVTSGDATGRSGITVAMGAGLLLLGVAAGVLAGLLGVGGGIIIVPALSLVFGMPLVVAKGTSLAVILPTALLGTARNHRAGLAALRPAAVVGGAGIVTAYFASKLSLDLDPALSRGLFGALLLAVGARLAHTGWNGRRADVATHGQLPSAVAAQVADAVADYDKALAAGDLDRVDSWFWADGETSRFGETGVIRGHASIAAARRNGTARSDPRTELEAHIVALSSDAAVATLEYLRPSTGRRGRRTQVWHRTDAGWRIVHAHLSLESESDRSGVDSLRQGK